MAMVLRQYDFKFVYVTQNRIVPKLM